MFEGKSIIITGASSGIGKALVENLSQYKCKLFIYARRENILEELKENLKEKPAEIYSAGCDAADNQQVQQCFNGILKHTDKIDIAILNAGIGLQNTPGEVDLNKARQSFDINLFGVINWMNLLIPHMKENKQGTISAVSSMADRSGFAGSAYYCASKAALSTYIEAIRGEMRDFGINVINVRPGFVRTPMTSVNDFKMPFLKEPEEMAAAIISGIVKNKRVINYPLATHLLTKFPAIVPHWVFDKLNKLPNAK